MDDLQQSGGTVPARPLTRPRRNPSSLAAVPESARGTAAAAQRLRKLDAAESRQQLRAARAAAAAADFDSKAALETSAEDAAAIACVHARTLEDSKSVRRVFWVRRVLAVSARFGLVCPVRFGPRFRFLLSAALLPALVPATPDFFFGLLHPLRSWPCSAFTAPGSYSLGSFSRE